MRWIYWTVSHWSWLLTSFWLVLHYASLWDNNTFTTMLWYQMDALDQLITNDALRGAEVLILNSQTLKTNPSTRYLWQSQSGHFYPSGRWFYRLYWFLVSAVPARLRLKAPALAWPEAASAFSNPRPGQSRETWLGSGLAWPRPRLLYVKCKIFLLRYGSDLTFQFESKIVDIHDYHAGGKGNTRS